MIDFDHLQSISPRYWLIPRRQWLSPDMIEKLLSVMFNPYLTNGFSHCYHLGDPTSVLRGIVHVCDFLKFYSIFNENSLSKQNRPRWDCCVLRRHKWGYSVCLCPIKGTLGLNVFITIQTNKSIIIHKESMAGWTIYCITSTA